MSYVEQSLLSQESIVATTKLHPIIFWKPVRNALCSLLFLWAGHSAAVLGLITASLARYSIGIGLGPLIGQALVTMAGLLAIVAVAGAVARLALYTTTEFAVTNKRVIAKYGSLRRRSLEVNLDKIESVSVHQSFTGRLLGFGTLRVRGTGSTDEVFGGIARALEFRRQIQQLATT
jgi:uncharacterized membrane protein YdbT with pleckstrin-like domain